MMFVDDILALSCDARAILAKIIRGTSTSFKNDKIEPHVYYLGAKLQKKPIKSLAISSQDYDKAAVKNVSEAIKRKGYKLPTTNSDTLMNITYSPELDITEEYNSNGTTYFQELIDVLRCSTEIGRVDELLG
ncbi:Reverse transcriptase (RNA-dependent DNA polymerase) [Fragilaria crotonensis]|nr:Reverse transcriptase (RNA-dependent DNA polymerase) [Fragilaria crotonensis]